MPDDTGDKQARTRFEPGKSGNPKGRPAGARSKLGEAFLDALHADFKLHGAALIEHVRLEKPDQYLKVVASILPKELDIRKSGMDDWSDEDLDLALAVLREGRAAQEREALH